MKPEDRNNFFKLVALIVDVACLVIWKYIKEKILGTDSFENFLNIEKHKLVHIYETAHCCNCMMDKITGERLISRKQLLQLYKLDDGNQVHDHKKYIGNKLTQICICKYSAKENINVRVVDITLANYIIQKCGKSELGVDNWIEQIKDVRNNIFHLSDIKEITDEKFCRKWEKLEGSIMGIATVINAAYAVETEQSIMQTKKLTVVGDYMLKYEVMCRDYWKNKCAEFERAQTQVIEAKAAALNFTMPQLFGTSMVKDCKETMTKIQTLNTMVDKINVMINIFGVEDNIENVDAIEVENEDMQRIHIPVFLQLEIPTTWDKRKMYKAVDEMRLNGTPEMNIRIKAISSDDLSIFADMTNNLLHNVHELRSEIDNMMSMLLSEAAIDTTEHAQVGVNLRVPERTGVNKTFEGDRHETTQEDVLAVRFFREAITKAVIKYVPLHSYIQDNMFVLFSHEKFYLLKHIMTDLAETENLGNIKSFIEDPRAFAQVWITKFIFEEEPNDLNLFTRLLHRRVSSIFGDLSTIVYKATTKNNTSISLWVKYFVDDSCKNLNWLPLSTSAFVHVTDRHLPDLQHFIDMLNTQFYEIECDVLESLIKENAISIEKRTYLVTSIIDRLWGCTELCRFCKEPCMDTDRLHVKYNIRHHCLQHRPCGIAGMKVSNNMLIPMDCKRIVTTNDEYKEVNGETRKYREYRTHFPHWDICPSSDGSKYWIWIFVKFQKELKEMHNAEFPDYPNEWDSITKAEAIASLD